MTGVPNHVLSLAAALWAIFACAGQAQSAAYRGMGAAYVKVDRTASYQFLEKIAKYSDIYPIQKLPGQKFPLDYTDLIPNAVVDDCSDADFRCLSFDRSAIAVPKGHLSPDASYTVKGNALTVKDCLRGSKKVCQVALIETRCFFHPVRKRCEPSRDESLPNELLSQMYFIYNEDYGVTSFGLAPNMPGASSAEMLARAKDYILLGDEGLLRP